MSSLIYAVLGPFHTGKFLSIVAVESQISQETFWRKQSTFESNLLSKETFQCERGFTDIIR